MPSGRESSCTCVATPTAQWDPMPCKLNAGVGQQLACTCHRLANSLLACWRLANSRLTGHRVGGLSLPIMMNAGRKSHAANNSHWRLSSSRDCGRGCLGFAAAVHNPRETSARLTVATRAMPTLSLSATFLELQATVLCIARTPPEQFFI
jgi:hypothetical protein